MGLELLESRHVPPTYLHVRLLLCTVGTSVIVGVCKVDRYPDRGGGGRWVTREDDDLPPVRLNGHPDRVHCRDGDSQTAQRRGRTSGSHVCSGSVCARVSGHVPSYSPN